MSSMNVSNLTKETLRKMFAQSKRFDGRGLLDFRDLEVTYNVSNKAEGSARVKLGKSEVIAGVKLQVGAPYPDSPNKGNLMVSGDLLLLASPRYELGPPGFDGIELPRLVDRGIRGAEMIELDKLVIKDGELVWTVIIDIYPINDDGNMIDAANLAAVAALYNTFLPEVDEKGKINYDKKTTKKLPLLKDTIPVSFSFFKLGDSLILDPTREEQEACDTRTTFTISKWEGQYMVNSCQKKDEPTLTNEEISKMMDILPGKYDEISKKLKTYLN